MVEQHFDINNQLSPTEKPARYHRKSAPKKEELEPMAEKTKTTGLSRPLAPIFARHGAPAGWVGNYRKKHDDACESCMCSRCYRRHFPDLTEGPIHGVHPKIQEQSEKVLVGLYEPVPEKRIKVPCRECGELIELEGKTAEKFDDRVEEVVHLACLDVESQASLRGIGYRLPHVVVQKESEDDVPTGEGPEDRDSDGGPPSGLGGGDEQASHGAEQQHRDGVLPRHADDEDAG